MDPVETIKTIAFLWASRHDLTVEEWEEREEVSQTSQAIRLLGRLGHEQMIVSLRSLTPAQALSVARWALAHDDLRPESYYWSGLLGAIANYVDGALVGLYPEMLARDLYYPAWVYRGADPATRDELIRRVEALTPEVRAANKQLLNELLLCLAWIGDEGVQRQFAAWREQPPSWRADLYIPPEDYAEEAGWESTPTGGRRDLAYAPAFELITAEMAREGNAGHPVVPVSGPLKDVQCQWCERPLAVLLVLDLRDPRLAFLGLAGTEVRIACCPFCSQFATVYTDVDTAGHVAWSAENILEEYMARILQEDPRPEAPLVEQPLFLGPQRHSVAEAVGGWGEESQLGGLPNWIQDAEYPECPTCGQRMPCVGQVRMGDVLEARYIEGITYAFLCANCGKAATSYQQT